MKSQTSFALLFTLIALAFAHGDHANDQIQLAADADWATRHMAGNQLSKRLFLSLQLTEIQRNTTSPPSTQTPSSNYTTSTPPGTGPQTTSNAYTVSSIGPTYTSAPAKKKISSRKSSRSTTRTAAAQSATPNTSAPTQKASNCPIWALGRATTATMNMNTRFIIGRSIIVVLM